MKLGAPGSFGAQLRALRETAGYTQEELATIAGLSVHAVSALERGQRRRPQVETVRALSAALDLTGAARDAFVARARSAAAATVVDELSPASLPLPLTALIGRDADVETLRQWLADPVARLVTLVGPGGVGKTRLALELAHGSAQEGSVRVRFVSLAALRDPGFVALAIAEAMGLADVTALDLPRRVRAACADHPTLLVLDNFEHVLPAVPLVADLLTSVSALRVLVTTRAPLHLRGERQYPVGPLALAPDSEVISLAHLARVPAVRLFVERVRHVQPDFRLTPANASTVDAVCRRLDALPLALELTAPWIKVLTPDDLLCRLERDTLLDSFGARVLPERQQTMNATVAWSYQLLDPNEQRAFRRFGVLPGLFSIEAAEGVLAGREAADCSSESLRLVGGLIDKSLLHRSDPSDGGRPRYQMLETVRAYATRELSAAGERDDALEGLVRYCTGEASLAADGLVGPAQIEWLDRVREDLENYRCALTWLVERGRSSEACEIAWRLMWFWVIRGQAEGLQWYEQTLKLPSLPPCVESKALAGAALMWFRQGELARARVGLSRALALARAAGDMPVIVLAEDFSGRVEHALGNLKAARDCFARSVEGFKTTGTLWGIGHVLGGLARVVLATGDSEQAERLLEEAASVLRHAGPWFRLRPLYARAILAVRRGNADEAIALVRESITRIRELQDKYSFVYVLVPLAAAAVLKGDHAWAARILGARDAVSERTGVTIVFQFVHDLRDEAEQQARAHLGPERWARAYAAGRETSIDVLIQDIDRPRT